MKAKITALGKMWLATLVDDGKPTVVLEVEPVDKSRPPKRVRFDTALTTQLRRAFGPRIGQLSEEGFRSLAKQAIERGSK